MSWTSPALPLPGGKMVIVNLQKTPKDQKADLIIRSKVDLVMALLMQELGLQVCDKYEGGHRVQENPTQQQYAGRQRLRPGHHIERVGNSADDSGSLPT